MRGPYKNRTSEYARAIELRRSGYGYRSIAGELEEGDQAILTGGTMSSTPGSTNLLQVYTVGEER